MIVIKLDNKDTLTFEGAQEEFGKIIALLEQSKTQFVELPRDIVKKTMVINKNNVNLIEIVTKEVK